MSDAIVHAVVALALVAAYVAVTLHGDDATGILGALGGYLGGAGASTALHVTSDRREAG